jgi:hypothetical protein
MAVGSFFAAGCRGRCVDGTWVAVGRPLDGEAVGAVPEPVHRGGGQQGVGERSALLFEVPVAGHDDRASFVALGGEFVEVLVVRGRNGLRP